MGLMDRTRALDDRWDAARVVRTGAASSSPARKRNRWNLVGFGALALGLLTFLLPWPWSFWIAGSWMPLLFLCTFWGGIAFAVYWLIRTAVEHGVRRALRQQAAIDQLAQQRASHIA